MGFTARTVRFATRTATPVLPCPPLEQIRGLDIPRINLFNEG